jgi:ankyrin repeat protein
LETLDFDKLSEEAPEIKNETAMWLLEQKVELAKECRNFLAQEDASGLFKDCPFHELCDKDEHGKPFLTPKIFFKDACYLAFLYQGAAQICTGLKKPQPLWPEVVRCRLMVAIFCGEERLVLWLLQNSELERGRVNYKSDMLGSALLAAVLGSHFKIVFCLIQYAANTRDIYAWEKSPPLTWAVMHRDVDVVRALLTSPLLDPNHRSDEVDEPLFVACFHGLEDIASLLLQDGRVHPDRESEFSGLTPLTVAIRKDHPEIVRLLIDRKQDINVNRRNRLNECALYAAAKKGNTEIVSYLLKWPDINVDVISNDNEKVTPLRIAVINKHQTTASLLLQFSNADPDLKSTPREPPLLLLAARRGLINVVDILLRRPGVDVNNIVNSEGNNAVSLAALGGHDELFHYLLQCYPVDLNMGNLNSPTFLLGVPNGNIMKTLLSIFPAKINNWDLWGQTALMRASMLGHDGVVKVLLDSDADASLRDNDGKTALDLARDQRYRRIVTIFTERGYY